MATARNDEDSSITQRGVGRRAVLLTGAGGLIASGAVATGHAPATAKEVRSREAAFAPRPTLRYFTDAEAATVTAMAERVFPADSESPGAHDAGVMHYIDGRLAGGWGNGDRLYMQGPFEEPQDSGHGYQLPLSPRDVYRRALAKIDAHCRANYRGNSFTGLPLDKQDEVLTALQNAQVDLGMARGPHGFTSAAFFTMFLKNVSEGLFADPIHGANRHFVGWRWVGFPGDPLAYGEPYADHIDKWNQPYNVEPRGVQ